jgi:hypothetical protein
MQHTLLRREAGISDQTYSSSDEDPLYGGQQGTRWATAAWSSAPHHHQSHAQKADGIQFKTRNKP